MYPLYLHFAIMLELERKLEREKLQKSSKLTELPWAIGKIRSRNKPGRKTAHWLGAQMVMWGSKLQTINTASPADIVVNQKLSR